MPLFLLVYCVLLPVFLTPLVVTRFLPGLELPFHLSIADLLDRVGEPGTPQRVIYDGQLKIAPYMAHYALLLLIGKWISMGWAIKIIMAAYVAVLPLAAARLLARCGRSRLPALLCFPLAYGMPMHYGFVSFALSLPVLLVVLAQVVEVARDDLVGSSGRLMVLAISALVLFFCHLQMFLFGLAGALVFIGLSRARAGRRLAAAGAFAPSLGALAYWAMTSGSAS